MLKILYPIKFENEKRYIIYTVFNYFLKIENISIEFSDQISENEVIISYDNSQESKKLVLYNGFFNQNQSDWLSVKTLPILPIKYTELNKLNGKFLYNELPVLFGKDGNEILYEINNSIYCNVDLLGGMFFFLTLYEEVVLDKIDEHGRFNYKDSFTYKTNLYTRPVVNEYLDVLIKLLAKIGFDNTKNNRSYQLIVSHDVDVPFSINATSFNFIRNLIADIFIRKSVSIPLKKILAKLIPIKSFKFKIDPYNNFDYIMNVSDRLGIRSTFNFIAIDGKGNIDGNYDIEDNFFRNLIKQIQERGHLIGLHPSYFTMTNIALLNNQLEKFKKISYYKDSNLTKVNARQHYLRWKNPITWQLYDDVGIAQDSSIGSEYFLGFRCGTCYEYPVFNLISRKQLKVTELPLLIMDVCAFKSKDKIKTLNSILEINKACKFYKGEMTLLYHNNYIITKQEKKKYEHLLSMLLSN